MITYVGLAEFARELKRRRGPTSQRKLSVMSGIAERTISRLESAEDEAPQSRRNTVMQLANAIGWPVDEALAMIGEGPLLPHEREWLDVKAPRDQLDRIWPYLKPQQRRAVTWLITTMYAEYAPEPVGTEPRPAGHPGLRIEPREHPRLPGQRDHDIDGPSTGE